MFEENEKTMEKKQQMITITNDLKSNLDDFKLNCFINQFYLYTFYAGNIHTSAVVYDLKKELQKRINNIKYYCIKKICGCSVDILYIIFGQYFVYLL